MRTPPHPFRTIPALLLLLLVALQAAPGLARQARAVVILSFDGMRADALQGVWPEVLRRQAAASWSARTVLPSLTLPAHTSMVSGVGPEVHGVRFNDWTPEMGRLTLPTIFTRVRAAGGGVVVLLAKPKLRFLVPADLPAEWLAFPRYRQAAVLELAAQRFRQERPALLFVHVADPDDAGHRRGWMSAPYLTVVGEVPLLVERFLEQLRAEGAWEQTLVLLTSDHGGHGVVHGSARPEDVTIPWIALGGLARAGVELTQQVMIYDTAATTLAALDLPVPPQWQGRPVREALAAIPAGR
ncbi:MAG: alkaline phosphatase [Armatimonadota bacterium]|nr:alkaline phosphatase [Armatimonadota bacterium]MDR7426915.1 alkaline phosphatase [Armatimonadota bacterium]MDR7463475.1 alkaline phosphatase [Armatimonadota bacterium]MDR7470529.1 alkaline phosphatase [Armatimonadota bacterium]MDR7474180.1 alkaline phosphatase [Armatimonadota bacterium]